MITWHVDPDEQDNGSGEVDPGDSSNAGTGVGGYSGEPG